MIRSKPYRMGRTFAIDSEERRFATTCHECGQQLIERVREVGFNAFTGLRRFSVLLVCPQWPVLNHQTWDCGFFDEASEAPAKPFVAAPPKARQPVGFQLRGDQ